MIQQHNTTLEEGSLYWLIVVYVDRELFGVCLDLLRMMFASDCFV